MIGSPQEPVVEEARETIDAQMEALEYGYIPVVMLPDGSTYMPEVPAALRSIHIPYGPGAGTYIFDPKQIKINLLMAVAAAGRHHELLGHLRSKVELQGRSTVIIRAIRKDGVILQDSIALHDDYVEQTEKMARRWMPLGANIVSVSTAEAPRIIEERTESRDGESILKSFQKDEYRIGNLQAIGYLRTRTDLFPEGYLGRLYEKMKVGISGKSGNSWLKLLFCGMQDVSYDAIVPYLATRPLCIMGEWKDGVFHEAGFIFPTVNLGMGDQKACFAGYGFFRQYWGTEEGKVLAMLGISFFFVELGLVALHGIRYADNGLTRNFLEPFGFQDTGVLKKHMLRNGKLVDGIPSTLLKEEFETYVETWLVEEYERGLRDVEPNDQEDSSGQHALFP